MSQQKSVSAPVFSLEKHNQLPESYKTLCNLYVEFHSEIPRAQSLRDAQALWKTLKKDKSAVENTIEGLRCALEEKSVDRNVTTAKKFKATHKAAPVQARNDHKESEQVNPTAESITSSSSSTQNAKSYETPRQLQVQRQIDLVNEEIENFTTQLSAGTGEAKLTEENIKECKERKKRLEAELKKLKSTAERMRKYRIKSRLWNQKAAQICSEAKVSAKGSGDGGGDSVQSKNACQTQKQHQAQNKVDVINKEIKISTTAVTDDAMLPEEDTEKCTEKKNKVESKLKETADKMRNFRMKSNLQYEMPVEVCLDDNPSIEDTAANSTLAQNKKTYETPKQLQVRTEIDMINKEIENLMTQLSTSSVDTKLVEENVEMLKEKKKKLENEMKKLKETAERMREYRMKSRLRNQKATEVCSEINRSSDDATECSSSVQNKKMYESPRQLQVRAEIDLVNKEMENCMTQLSAGTGDTKLAEENMEKLKLKKKKLYSKLRRLNQTAERMRKYRMKTRLQNRQAAKLCSDIVVRDHAGRPSLEESQPGLLETIASIASKEGAADPQQRSEMLCMPKTLNDLHRLMKEKGFNLSRTALYNRLIPRKWNSPEGKRHSTTVPVRLIKPRNDSRRNHLLDAPFVATTIKHVKELASILGPKQVTMISQGDMSRVSLGITCAKDQSLVDISVEYRLSLPDQDFVVAEQHKLIPSIYAGLTVEDSNIGDPSAVRLTGPTYIAIRSGKHDSSTAFTHGRDLETLFTLPAFNEFARHGEEGALKPVFVIFCDAGPEESPKFDKVLQVAITIFRKYELDALFITTHVADQADCSPVEKRIASLSHDIAGIVLDQSYYGTHLNAVGKTIDTDLEIRNFQHAGESLARIWSNTVIDSFPVVAEYVTPSEPKTASYLEIDHQFAFNHVRQSNYTLQIVKCGNRTCCKEPRSDLLSVLPERFLPYPRVVSNKESRLAQCNIKGVEHQYSGLFLSLAHSVLLKRCEVNTTVPYDFYCPSLDATEIAKRTCPVCSVYYPSQASMKRHHKAIHGSTVGNEHGYAAGNPQPAYEDGQEIPTVREVLRDRESNGVLEFLCVLQDGSLEWLSCFCLLDDGVEHQNNIIQGSAPVQPVYQNTWEEIA